MKKELNYVAPSLEVIEVMVEAGFAASNYGEAGAAAWGAGNDDLGEWGEE